MSFLSFFWLRLSKSTSFFYSSEKSGLSFIDSIILSASLINFFFDVHNFLSHTDFGFELFLFYEDLEVHHQVIYLGLHFFLLCQFIAINFPFKTVFITSFQFWCVVVSLSFDSRKCLISSLICSVVH